MPYDSESEAGVLGYIATLEDAEEDVYDLLFDKCFHCADTTEVWHCIKELKQKEQEVNLFTITALMKEKGYAGGGVPPFLLRNNVVSRETAIWAVEKLHRKAQERAIIEAGYKLIQLGQYNTKHVDKQKEGNELEKEVTSLLGGLTYQTALEDYTTSARLFEKVYSEIPKEPVLLQGVTTGFMELDWILGGWQEENLIYIGGRPGTGKTAFILNSCYRASKKPLNGKFLFYSLEQSEKQLAHRLMAIAGSTDFSTADIRRGSLEKEQWEDLQKIKERLKALPILWKYPKDKSFATFERTISAIMKKEKLAGIIVDHIGHFTFPAANETEKTVKVAHGLQALIAKVGCPIIALAQLNRECDKRVNKKPCIADFKQSSAIEETGYIALLLYREELYDPDTEKQGLITVIVAKNREGVVGELDLQFNKQTLTILDLEKEGYDGTPF